jgi:hypothetical protein
MDIILLYNIIPHKTSRKLEHMNLSSFSLPVVFVMLFITTLIVVNTLVENYDSSTKIPLLLQKAYADGLTQENLPPASLGDREGSLFVKINPPIYTTESEEDAFMQFRLFDANTNETVQHVTYDITVSKGANPAEGERPLLRDFFHAHNGLLTLKVEPTNGSLTIFGDRDPFQAAYVADPGGTINLRGPVLQEGGLYRFDIQIFGIDNDRNIFVPEQAPKFETFLSVGDVFNFENLEYEGQTFNSTLISYYDKIEDFTFDSTNGEFSWSMPFYYDVQRLQENPIFVHEEIKLPKNLFGSSTFNATVNGQPISGRTLAVDPFTSPDAIILHYLINKNDVIKIANEWEGGAAVTQPVSLGAEQGGGSSTTSEDSTGNQNVTGTMDFTLRTTPPQPAAVSTSVDAISTDLLSDTGGIHAAVEWSPLPILPNTESTAKFNFTDAFSGGSLNADVMYDLSVLDSDGAVVHENDGLIARNSQDTQTVTFPAAGTYQLALEVTGLQPLTEQQSESPLIDRTRNGIARGTVIVSAETDQTSQEQTPPQSQAVPSPVPVQPTTNDTNENLGNITDVQSLAEPAPQVMDNESTGQQQDNQTVGLEQQPQQQPQEQQQDQSERGFFEQMGDAFGGIFGGN